LRAENEEKMSMTKEDVIDELLDEQKFHRERIEELEKGIRDAIMWLKFKDENRIGQPDFIMARKILPILEKALDE
jgi:hypothetical protein